MSPNKGYYCLIQYCPDLSRSEAANVGVLLFCPDRNYIRAQTATGNDRIRKFFGSKDDDWEQINAAKRAIENRLEVEADTFRTFKDLEAFVATRANEIQITAPRPMKVDDPDKDLDDLFQQLVGGRVKREAKKAPSRLEKILTQELSKEDLVPRIQKDVTVEVPVLRSPLRVPFAYRNGRVNLIRHENFVGSGKEHAENKACRLAVEGRSLYGHRDLALGEIQLVVVGDLPSEEPEKGEVVRCILEENKVRFYGLENLPDLIEDIRTTGRPFSGTIEDAASTTLRQR